MAILLYGLIFLITCIVTGGVAFIICALFIKNKTKHKRKYHYTSPADTPKIIREFELKPTGQIGVDGHSALNDFKKG